MRAVWYTKLGSAAEVLESGEIAAPEPGAGEVQVRVMVSGVNPVDTKRRAGGRGGIEAPLVVPHFDGAGVIERVGQGVPESRIGERVWLYEAQWQRSFGTAAEFVALDAGLAIPLPETTGFAEGACLGIPALTAHRCVFADGPVTGQTVLVTGGAGAVGHYALQFAKLGGAEVITMVSGPEKATIAAAAGADHVINYKFENVAERVKELTEGAGVDRIVEVELGGNLDACVEVIKANGVIAAYASQAVPEPLLPFYPMMFKNLTLREVLVFGMPEAAKQQAVADIGGWLAAASLRHHVGRSLPLEQAVKAHEAVEQGAFGKVLLEVSE